MCKDPDVGFSELQIRNICFELDRKWKEKSGGMEVEESVEHEADIPVVSLEDVPCTVDTKAIEENGVVNNDLGFTTELSSDQVSSLAHLGWYTFLLIYYNTLY